MSDVLLDRSTLLRELLALAQMSGEFLGCSLQSFDDYMSFNGRQVLFGCTRMLTGRSMWANYVLYREHEQYVQILSFGTHPDCRRRGLASSVFDVLTKVNKRLVAYVPRENFDAAAFLLAIGFEQAGELVEGFNDKLRYSRPARKA